MTASRAVDESGGEEAQVDNFLSVVSAQGALEEECLAVRRRLPLAKLDGLRSEVIRQLSRLLSTLFVFFTGCPSGIAAARLALPDSISVPGAPTSTASALLITQRTLFAFCLHPAR